MSEKFVATMLSIGEALRTGYTDLATLAEELFEWHTSAGPFGRRDNRDRSYHLWDIACELALLKAPDVSALPHDLMDKEVCANVHVGRGSREARKQDSLAKLRPAAAAIGKAGYSDTADKVRRDVSRADDTRHIPGAYEGGL